LFFDNSVEGNEVASHTIVSCVLQRSQQTRGVQ